MGKIILINIAIVLFISCVEKQDDKYPCIIDFWFDISYAPGPDGLISVVLIKDSDLRNKLLSSIPPAHLLFKYHGTIYNIDSLRFTSPYRGIDINDSTVVFWQSVVGLYEYSYSFMDSIVGITKKELVIEITDTLSGEKWIIPNCTCIDSLGILDNYYKSLREKAKYGR